MVTLKTANELNELIKNPKVLVEFCTEWSTPCKMIDMVLEEIENEQKDIIFIKVDIDRYRSIAKEYKVLNVPVICIISDGRVLKQQSGMMRKEELLDLIQQF